jgi:hypothetical protein
MRLCVWRLTGSVLICPSQRNQPTHCFPLQREGVSIHTTTSFETMTAQEVDINKGKRIDSVGGRNKWRLCGLDRIKELRLSFMRAMGFRKFSCAPARHPLLLLLAVALLLLLTIPRAAVAYEVTLYPVQDSYASSIYPSSNFGSDDSLNVINSGAFFEHTYLQFDLSSLPSGYIVASAELELHLDILDGEDEIGIYELLGGWTESGLTWFNQPTASHSSVGSAMVTYDDFPTAVWDVTALARSWENTPEGNHGLMMRSTSEPTSSGSYMRFYSSEAAGSYGPRMTVQLSLDQVVTFPDPALEAAVRDAIAKPTGNIYQSDLIGLTLLEGTSRGIEDLEGIQHCTDLVTLWLGNNEISDVSLLSGLSLLRVLHLYNNRIADISALASLTGLTHLELYQNRIADISALSSPDNLSLLYLRYNQITDIGPLIANAGIDSGDDVDVRWNLLCLTAGSADVDDVNTLLGRGVDLLSSPQTACGGTSAIFKVDQQGNVLGDQTVHADAFETSSADVAEWVPVNASVEPGDVLELDPDHPHAYRVSTSPCSSLITGVVSQQPGVVLGAGTKTEARALLALVGIVPVKVTNEGGPIRPGDLLVSSSTPGHAMRWSGSEPCPCALVGKALEPMAKENGVILVLLVAH